MSNPACIGSWYIFSFNEDHMKITNFVLNISANSEGLTGRLTWKVE